jgi:hypothetical protein
MARNVEIHDCSKTDHPISRSLHLRRAEVITRLHIHRETRQEVSSSMDHALGVVNQRLRAEKMSKNRIEFSKPNIQA